ncbi:MAG: CDP-alcohol phosphatidyltransferase family protein [Flavobacteriales bacterium]
MKRHLPNVLTLANLFCGCIATVLLLEGPYYTWAALMTAFSLIFDFLDGLFARILHAKSPMGKELDSLADIVSFGLVPGIIVFTFLKNDLGKDHFLEYAWAAFFITLFSAWRLAHFNLDIYQNENFKGLATPVNTLFFMALTITKSEDPGYALIQTIINSPILILTITFISCYLLVSTIPMFSLKFKSFSWNENKHRYIFLVLAGLFLIILRSSALPCIIILYIITSIFCEKNFT